jgi:hypothetical protein
MTSHEDTFPALIGKVALYILAWIGSWKIGEVQALAGVLSALVIAAVGALNGYVIWRDKIRYRPREGGE